MKKKGFVTFILATFFVLLSGCSSEEPNIDINKEELIKSITFKEETIYSYQYDYSGRLVKFVDYLAGQTILISRNPLRLKVTFEEGDPNDDSFFEFYDLKLNDRNYISQCKVRYDPGTYYTGFREETTVDFKYDTKGHLLEVQGFFNSVYKFKWDDGCLIKGWKSDQEINYYTSGKRNISSQWTPVWYLFGGLEASGFFGAPPEYLISQIDISIISDSSEYTEYFNYTLNPKNGLLEVIEDDGLPLTINY